MRVLLSGLVLDHAATGIARVTLGLYEAALALDPELRVTVLHRRRLACELPAGMVERQAAAALPGPLWRGLIFPAAEARLQPEVVHFPWNGSVTPRVSGARVVTTLHDVLPLVIPGFFANDAARQGYLARTQRDLDRTDLLITDSEYSRGQIMAHLRPRREPVVIYPATTLGQATSVAPPLELPESYFVYVGGYHPRKGLDSMVRLVGELHARGRLRSPLVLTGERQCYSQRFRELVAEGVRAGALRETGYVSDAELAGLLRGARALVYPSLYEGFGLPPLEAMAVGCPVLTTRGTAIPEVCQEAACYVDPGDEAEFAQALEALERDADWRAELAARGLARAAAFTWEASARRFLGCLREPAGAG